MIVISKRECIPESYLTSGTTITKLEWYTRGVKNDGLAIITWISTLQFS